MIRPLLTAASLPTLHFLVALNLLRIPYPEVRRDVTVVDDYFGTKVSDPYRWLEDLNSEDTKNFVESQQRLTDDFFSSIPTRDKIRESIKSLWNYSRISVPMKVQSRYYSMRNSGLQNHSVIYVQESLDGAARPFFDPSTLSPDGTVTLDSFTFSNDGQYFAYFTQDKGSDWRTIRFKDAMSGADLPDVLENSKYPHAVWSADNQGVFYLRFPFHDKTNMAQVTLNEKIFYHRISNPQEKDVLIAEFPWAPLMRLNMEVTHDGNYLLITGVEAFNTTSIYILPLWEGINANLRSKIVALMPSPSKETYDYITNDGTTFIFRTSEGANNFRLAAVSVNFHRGLAGGHSISMWSTFIPEDPERVLDGAVLIAPPDKLLLRYIHHGNHQLELHSLLDGSLQHKLDLPPGTVSDFYSSGNINGSTCEFFVKIEHFLNPGTIFRCLASTAVHCDVFHQISIPGVNFNNYAAELVRLPSTDETEIAMHIVRKKSQRLNGTAPALLYGYGGFNTNTLPVFSISSFYFVEHFGGIYAEATIRGGGEYGTKWYADGSMLNRQNSLNDFQSAAEYLIEHNYTSPSKLTIKGSSHGGLVVAACVNQRPELYGAAIVQVGVLDLLRHQHFTVGKLWCTEYGCSDNKIHFESLITYSPLHNIRVPKDPEIQYPAVLVMTADHDDRVVPSHSYKYAAELQHTVGSDPKQTNPLLLRIAKNAGHSNAKSLHRLIDDVTDILSFISESLGLTVDVSF